MKAALHTTLRFKIALYIVILLLVTASLFSLITVQTMNRHILDEVIKRAESLCRSTAALAPYSILSGDLLGIDNIVSKVKEANTDVEYVAVTNAEMKILAHTDIVRRGNYLSPLPALHSKRTRMALVFMKFSSRQERCWKLFLLFSLTANR